MLEMYVCLEFGRNVVSSFQIKTKKKSFYSNTSINSKQLYIVKIIKTEQIIILQWSLNLFHSVVTVGSKHVRAIKQQLQYTVCMTFI